MNVSPCSVKCYIDMFTQTNTSCCSMTHQPVNKQLHSVEITLLVKSHHMSIAIGKMNWKLVMFDNPDQ